MQPHSTASDPTAVIGRRIAAYLVDGLLGVIITTFVFFALAENPSSTDQLSTSHLRLIDEHFDPTTDFEVKWNVADSFGGVHSDDELWFVEGGEFWFVNLVSLGYAVLMFVSLQAATGRTLGKALFGIATVDEQGQPPGLGKAFLRWAILFVDSFFFFLPGLITMLASRGHRRIGDLAAHTYVVRADAIGQPVAVGIAPVAPSQQWQGYVPPPQPPQPGEPQWDPARNAYIRWDADEQRWFQWYEGEQQWRPIS